MKFRQGDLLICVDASEHSRLKLYGIYTAAADSRLYVIDIKEISMNCISTRFEKIDLTELEKVIYGLKTD